MKKSKLVGFLSVGVMTVAGSLLANNSSQKSVDDFVSLNLEALDESAGDMWCDQTNETPCSIEAPSGHIGRSTGILRVHWD